MDYLLGHHATDAMDNGGSGTSGAPPNTDTGAGSGSGSQSSTPAGAGSSPAGGQGPALLDKPPSDGAGDGGGGSNTTRDGPAPTTTANTLSTTQAGATATTVTPTATMASAANPTGTEGGVSSTAVAGATTTPGPTMTTARFTAGVTPTASHSTVFETSTDAAGSVAVVTKLVFETTAPTGIPPPLDAAPRSGPNLGAIIGGVIGSVGGLVLLVWIVLLPMRKSQMRKREVEWLAFGQEDDHTNQSSAEAVYGRPGAESSNGHSRGAGSINNDGGKGASSNEQYQMAETNIAGAGAGFHPAASYGGGATGGASLYSHLDAAPSAGGWAAGGADVGAYDPYGFAAPGLPPPLPSGGYSEDPYQAAWQQSQGPIPGKLVSPVGSPTGGVVPTHVTGYGAHRANTIGLMDHQAHPAASAAVAPHRSATMGVSPLLGSSPDLGPTRRHAQRSATDTGTVYETGPGLPNLHVVND